MGHLRQRGRRLRLLLYEPKPSWQTDTGCAKRTVADVSAVADPNTGVAVYETYGASGWNVYGGTSASSPIIASVYAVAGTPPPARTPTSYPYANTGALNDVTPGTTAAARAAVHRRLRLRRPDRLGHPERHGAFTG